MPQTANPGLLTKQLSGQLLSAFITDICRRTDRGLTRKQCDTNAEWLEALTDACASIPDGELKKKKVFQRMEEFTAVYKIWNSPDNDSTHRDKLRPKLRKKANKVASAYRVRTKLLEEHVDIDDYRRYYNLASDLVERLPDILEETAKVLVKLPLPDSLQSAVKGRQGSPGKPAAWTLA